MGGEGSGRKPNPENVARSFAPGIKTGDQGSALFIPNYSGLKDETRKTNSTDIGVTGFTGNLNFDTISGFHAVVIQNGLILGWEIIAG